MKKRATNSPDSSAHASRLQIGHALGRMRRMIGRRVLSRLVIDRIAPDLELSHLDVLDAVKRAHDPEEMTVGAIADGMRIDPSRASRIVSDMVARGVLRREASQADARRIVVAPTEWGAQLIAEVDATKRTVIDTIVSDWPEEDVALFARQTGSPTDWEPDRLGARQTGSPTDWEPDRLGARQTGSPTDWDSGGLHKASRPAMHLGPFPSSPTLRYGVAP